MAKLTKILQAITALVLAAVICLAAFGLLLWVLGSIRDQGHSYQLATTLISASIGLVLAGYFIPWFTKSDDRFLAALFGLIFGLSSGIYLLGSSPDIVLVCLVSVLLAVLGSAIPKPWHGDASPLQAKELKVDHIFETVLYAGDLAAAEDFYHRVLGLEALQKTDLMLVFQCSQGVLLIFDPALSGEPGRSLPLHGARGPGHLAFLVQEADLEAWRDHFQAHGIGIEHEQSWPAGGRSLYFRDPAGNSLELASPQLWGGGWDR